MSRVVLCALWLFPLNAAATGPLHGVPIQQDTSLERYANDLVGDDTSERLYAVRVLRRRVRGAWRIAGRNNMELRVIEARQTLSHFDTLVAPRCIRQLKVANTRKGCASILGMLETADALDELRAAQHTTNRKSDVRVIQRAIHRIEGVQ